MLGPGESCPSDPRAPAVKAPYQKIADRAVVIEPRYTIQVNNRLVVTSRLGIIKLYASVLAMFTGVLW